MAVKNNQIHDELVEASENPALYTAKILAMVAYNALQHEDTLQIQSPHSR